MGKLIYVCSPYSGDIEGNTIKAQTYSRYVVEQGHFPIAPHLLLPQFIDEETEREKAMGLNYKLLDWVDELWVFGEDTTEGMLDEISYATTKDIPICEMGNIADIQEDVLDMLRGLRGELDPIENPPHYNHGKYEVKDVIRDWNLNFHLGNVIKYVARCDHKDNKLQDLKKARFCLDDEIKFLEEKEGERYCEEIDG
ncbi:MAG TPA: DUF3310 domain-containing protein [Tissierellaceae bacterium]|nr:DUF3310 domain-containing protein [Tissierellaceae bacterium]